MCVLGPVAHQANQASIPSSHLTTVLSLYTAREESGVSIFDRVDMAVSHSDLPHGLQILKKRLPRYSTALRIEYSWLVYKPTHSIANRGVNDVNKTWK